MSYKGSGGFHLNFSFFLFFIYFVCFCHGNQRTICGNQFSLFTMWIPGPEFRSSSKAWKTKECMSGSGSPWVVLEGAVNIAVSGARGAVGIPGSQRCQEPGRSPRRVMGVSRASLRRGQQNHRSKLFFKANHFVVWCHRIWYLALLLFCTTAFPF